MTLIIIIIIKVSCGRHKGAKSATRTIVVGTALRCVAGLSMVVEKLRISIS